MFGAMMRRGAAAARTMMMMTRKVPTKIAKQRAKVRAAKLGKSRETMSSQESTTGPEQVTSAAAGRGTVVYAEVAAVPEATRLEAERLAALKLRLGEWEELLQNVRRDMTPPRKIAKRMKHVETVGELRLAMKLTNTVTLLGHQPDVGLSSVLIRTAVRLGRPDLLLDMIHNPTTTGFAPSARSVAFLTRSLIRDGHVDMALHNVKMLVRRRVLSVPLDVNLYGALILGSIKAGRNDVVMQLADEAEMMKATLNLVTIGAIAEAEGLDETWHKAFKSKNAAKLAKLNELQAATAGDQNAEADVDADADAEVPPAEDAAAKESQPQA